MCLDRKDTASSTSADGTVITPANIAVCHSETSDALGALEFIAFIAGEMHCSSSSVDRVQAKQKFLDEIDKKKCLLKLKYKHLY